MKNLTIILLLLSNTLVFAGESEGTGTEPEVSSDTYTECVNSKSEANESGEASLSDKFQCLIRATLG